MAPKRPADNNTQKNQTQQATLNKNIPQQPKVTTNNKNNQKLTQNIEKYPDNPEICQNSYKKALGAPQNAQKAPRPAQSLPKTLPKPSLNPSQIRRAACSARRVRAHRHLLLFNICISLLGGAKTEL